MFGSAINEAMTLLRQLVKNTDKIVQQNEEIRTLLVEVREHA